MGALKTGVSDFSENDLTPAMAQYVALKKKHSDCLLFFQMGDFYELFFDDAVLVARLLELTLTRRGKAAGQDIPMCGVPMRAGDAYIGRLLYKGHKVALCIQMETPSGKAGPLKREVARILTPGTSLEEVFLTDPANNFLMVVAPPDKGVWGIALADVSTGDLFVENASDLLKSQLLLWNPKEIVVPFESFEDTHLSCLRKVHKGRLSTLPARRFKQVPHMLVKMYGVAFDHVWRQQSGPDIKAAEALVDYLHTLLQALPNLNPPVAMSAETHMRIDGATRRNLEFTSTLSGTYKGSLLSVINHAVTPSGQRLIAMRLNRLSIDVNEITRRHRAVDYWVKNPTLLEKIRGILSSYGDLERSLTRLTLGHKSPKDVGAIRDGLIVVQKIRGTWANCGANSSELDDLEFDGHDALRERLSQALCDLLPRSFDGGQVIREGFDEALDNLANQKKCINDELSHLEQTYRMQLEVETLKIKQNNLIGFYIDIPARHQSKVPKTFQLRQGLAQSARYTTPELLAVVGQLDGATDAALVRETTLFEALIEDICAAQKTLKRLAHEVAVLDVACALAYVARTYNCVCPKMTLDRRFCVTEGRHLVVESVLRDAHQTFQANDCAFDDLKTLALVTGPNMAGKSTYLRQNALIVVLAHLGAFVPATHAEIGIVDALFSRVGASDNLLGGESTFMVEMKETAHILHDATPNSFVIVDEVGRGTSTRDGLAIASGCVDYFVNTLGCRTLFSTHYFELTKLVQRWDKAMCLTLDVHAVNDTIVFLHTMIQGAATQSYGLEVARLAGLPDGVLRLSKSYLEQLKERAPLKSDVQDYLCSLDVEALSPKDALDELFRLKALCAS